KGLPGPQALAPAGGFGAGGVPLKLEEFAKNLDKGVGAGRIQQEQDRLTYEARSGDAKGKKAAKDAMERQTNLQKAQAAFNGRQLYQVQQGAVGVDFACMNNALRHQTQTSRTASRFV